MADQPSEKVAQAKLLQAVRDLIQREEDIRKEHGIGENLRVVRNRLQALLKDLEANVNLSLEDETQNNKGSTSAGSKEVPIDDEHAVVFVHLFNAGGERVSRWCGLLTQKAVYEYSVNRPVYARKKHVELFIESKPPEDHHAYVSFKVAKENIIGGLDVTNGNVDAIDQPLLKLKEGAISLNNLIELTYKGQAYEYKAGKLVAKA